MKSRFIVFLSLFVFMMMAAPQALALNIQILPDGKIEFYTGSVLGKNDDRNEKQEEVEQKINQFENKIRTINQGEEKELKIMTDQEKIRIEVQDQIEDVKKDAFKKTEKIEAEDVRVQFPSQYSEKQLEAAKNKQESMKEAAKKQVEEKFGDNEQIREELKNKIEEKEEKYQAYWNKLKEERQEREMEMVELKNQLKNKKQTLELQSRNVKAALQQGAEFILDPASNEVVVMTPSGQEHTLYHLPDQAIERMRAAGFYMADEMSEEEVEVQVYDNGELYYHKPDKIQKRLFGVIPVQIDSEVILNDQTGEVIEREAQPNTIFEQFFNSVSF